MFTVCTHFSPLCDLCMCDQEKRKKKRTSYTESDHWPVLNNSQFIGVTPLVYFLKSWSKLHNALKINDFKSIIHEPYNHWVGLARYIEIIIISQMSKAANSRAFSMRLTQIDTVLTLSSHTSISSRSKNTSRNKGHWQRANRQDRADFFDMKVSPF